MPIYRQAPSSFKGRERQNGHRLAVVSFVGCWVPLNNELEAP
jgi:hypothetical protein